MSAVLVFCVVVVGPNVMVLVVVPMALGNSYIFEVGSVPFGLLDGFVSMEPCEGPVVFGRDDRGPALVFGRGGLC